MLLLRTGRSRGFSSFSNGVGWGVSLPFAGASNGLFATKYRITRPYNEHTKWEDFLISLPEQSELWRFTKDVPLFVRYLKLVTDKESRQSDFSAWVTKHREGLVVESDVFLSVPELLAVMWKNGYSEQERNAIQFTFPSDYRFHYPEISVLFDVAESEVYKFCMRARMDNSHIGELAVSARPASMLRDHWLLYASGWFLFKNYAFFNYAFFLKTWGFTVWFVSVWTLFSRQAHRLWTRNEQALQQKVADDLMTGEDSIVAAMRRFAHDAKAVDHLASLKSDLTDSLTLFSSALVNAQRHALHARVTQQLDSILRAEAASAANFQNLLVTDTFRACKADLLSTAPLQRAAFDFAVARLAGTASEAGAQRDPVLQHVQQSLEAAAGGKSERLQQAVADAEVAFNRTFAVQKAEVAQIRILAAAGGGFDEFNCARLSPEQLKELEQLYDAITDRCGFLLPHENALETPAALDTAAKRDVQQARLKAFVAAFTP